MIQISLYFILKLIIQIKIKIKLKNNNYIETIFATNAINNKRINHLINEICFFLNLRFENICPNIIMNIET